MTDKPDPAKDAGRTDNSAGKRPHATLDLKATEVPSSAPPPSSASAASAASAGTASAASTAKDASAKDTTAKDKDAAAAAAAKTVPPGASKPVPPPKPEAKPEAARSGGGFFSHLAAGIIGGALVYSGASYLGPAWLPGSSGADSELAQRVAALENAPKSDAAIPALTAKVGDAESRLAEIDALKQSLAALKDEHEKLASKSTAQDGQEPGPRLSKLEEQLSMLASSAAGTSDGKVPQLAAITGKIADLESTFTSQIADLRKSLPAEVDQRLAATAETSESAKAAAARLDREMSQIRTDQARSAQRDEGTEADLQRLTSAVDAVKEETGRLSSSLGELRSLLDSQLKAVSRPADIAAAITPVTTKLAEIEQNVQGVVMNEKSRKQNVERIVLSLELSNLKRALDRGEGQGYAAELAEVRNASQAGKLDLAPLERYATTGVATVAELKSQFRPVMNAVIDAELDPVDGSVLDRLMAGAKSVVRVRKVSHEAGDNSAEAIVARIETALDDSRLGDVIAQARTLPQRAQVPIEDWLSKVEARHAVDQAIAAIDGQLKASLAGATDGQAPAAQDAPAPPAPAQN